MSKDLYIFAGVNGAGKSTLYNSHIDDEGIKNSVRINTDEIVRTFGDWRNNVDQIKAGKIAITLKNKCFNEEKSFNEETTLTGKTILKTINRAKELGYKIYLYYIGVDSPEIAKERVRNRVLKGGHNISSEVIEKRYYESLENLKKIIESDSNVKLPKDARYAKVLKFILSPMFKFYFKYKYSGKENLGEGAGIIVGNHQSYLDAFMLNNAFTYKELSNNYYIATALHFKSKTMKYLAGNGNIILVDANRNLKNTLQAAAKVLKSGKKLLIFPEGARTRDGQLQEFKKTFAILAQELNVPIYPFVLKGAYEAFPYNKKFPKRYDISVQFLEKIDPQNKTVEELVEETKDKIAKNYY